MCSHSHVIWQRRFKMACKHSSLFSPSFSHVNLKINTFLCFKTSFLSLFKTMSILASLENRCQNWHWFKRCQFRMRAPPDDTLKQLFSLAQMPLQQTPTPVIFFKLFCYHNRLSESWSTHSNLASFESPSNMIERRSTFRTPRLYYVVLWLE